LLDVDSAAAKEAAQMIIDGYPGNIPPEQPPSHNRYAPVQSPEAKRFVVAYALKLASENGKKQDASRLKFIIENEEKEREKKKNVKPEANPNPWAIQGNTITVPPAPLLEYALLELGRLKDPANEGFLIQYTKNKDSDARAEGCFALAALGSKNCKQALVELLSDQDGWIRFSAYKALCGLAKIKVDDKDYTADWLYGNDSSRSEAVKKWREWLSKS
jgi:HEAT repeat protein